MSVEAQPGEETSASSEVLDVRIFGQLVVLFEPRSNGRDNLG